MSEVLTLLRTDRIHHVRIDDGSRNVLTLEIVEALHAIISAIVENDRVKCLIIEGNSRALSVGLDTRTVLSGTDDSRRLLKTMGEILKLLYLSRLRSLVITEGHATAAGAMLLLVADFRIGCGAGGKIGLSEVGVGIDVPAATQQLVRDRIATANQFEATALSRLYDFPDARTVGYLDDVVSSRDQASRLAEEHAELLAGLAEDAYLATKLGMRQSYRALVEV